MAKRGIARAKLTKLEARTRTIHGMRKLSFVAFCVALGFVVVATAVPQRREMKRLEGKLALAKERAAVVTADVEYHKIEYRALKEDPTFLENQARDRLDYYREGERVLKFRDAVR